MLGALSDLHWPHQRAVRAARHGDVGMIQLASGPQCTRYADSRTILTRARIHIPNLVVAIADLPELRVGM